MEAQIPGGTGNLPKTKMKEKIECIKLEFLSPLHCGEAGIGIEKVSEFIHSDTIFSALCNAWARIYGKEELGEILNRFPTSINPKLKPPFYISSAFLYSNDILFFPKPLFPPAGIEKEEIRIKYGRELKKIEFIPQDMFISWIKNEEIDFEKIEEIKDIYDKSFKKYLTPRVQIDRINSSSGIYHCGQISFNKNAGLYFLLKTNDENSRKWLQEGLNFLTREGLGGERASGCGQFILKEWGSIELDLPDSANGYIILSLLSPENRIVSKLKQARYKLLERKGWIFSPFTGIQTRKRPVMMISEGSIFNEKPEGILIDVTPDGWSKEEIHTVYRYGIAFSIPIRMKK